MEMEMEIELAATQVYSRVVQSHCNFGVAAGPVSRPPTPPTATVSNPKSSLDIETQSACGETTESTTANCCNPRASVVRRRLRTSANTNNERPGFSTEVVCLAQSYYTISLGPGVGGHSTGVVLTNEDAEPCQPRARASQIFKAPDSMQLMPRGHTKYGKEQGTMKGYSVCANIPLEK